MYEGFLLVKRIIAVAVNCLATKQEFGRIHRLAWWFIRFFRYKLLLRTIVLSDIFDVADKNFARYHDKKRYTVKSFHAHSIRVPTCPNIKIRELSAVFPFFFLERIQCGKCWAKKIRSHDVHCVIDRTKWYVRKEKSFYFIPFLFARPTKDFKVGDLVIHRNEMKERRHRE